MLRFAQHDRRPFEQLTRRVVAAHKTVNYASGDDHARRNLRYQGVAQETPALRGRSHIRWRTSIQSKQRDKYETNEINENIGNRRALRGSGEYGAGTDYNDHNDEAVILPVKIKSAREKFCGRFFYCAIS